MLFWDIFFYEMFWFVVTENISNPNFTLYFTCSDPLEFDSKDKHLESIMFRRVERMISLMS